MSKTIEVIVEPNGTIRPLETLQVSVPTRALLTFPDSPSGPAPLPKGSQAALVEFLETNALPAEKHRTAADIDRQIEEERSAWD